MKESKFIELLNLYVDHQISASDAALLEAEIQRNPERRRIYREYCQMQKACAILAESFRPQTQAAGGQVVEFPRRSGWTRATYVMGAMAAAACVAVVVVNRERLTGAFTPEATPVFAAATNAEVPAPVEAVAAEAPAPAATRPALQPVFAGLVRENAPVSSFGTAQQLDWLSQVKLEPVAVDTLWFKTKPTLHTENVMLRDGLQPVQRQDEVLPVAWRFQR